MRQGLALGMLLLFSEALHGNPKRILGENGLEPIESTIGDNLYGWSEPVAQILRHGRAQCSATLISRDLVLTNYHCDVGCDNITLRFNYEKDLSADSYTVHRCLELVHKSKKLDYAIFKIEPNTEVAPASFSSELPPLGAPLFLTQYPRNGFKLIDRSQSCILTSRTPILTQSGRLTLTHTCDSEAGSSGAPVMDRMTGLVIGIHWGGVDQTTNYLIPASLILKDLKTNTSSILFDQLSIE